MTITSGLAGLSRAVVDHLDQITLLNRTIYGTDDDIGASYRKDYDAARDPDDVGSRSDLAVYDRYDRALASGGLRTLSSAELGFAAGSISASEISTGFDHNYTYAGDLFRNTYRTLDDGTEVAFPQAGAVALTAVKPNATGKTLYLTFRGTDADGITADGEAGTAIGQIRYYQQLKSLIDQVYDYVSDAAHKVTEVVVSGHSLGGAMADMFTLYDGARFAGLAGINLKVVAMASSGVSPDVFKAMTGYDPALVSTAMDGTVSLSTPGWYSQIDNAIDIVRNPGQYDGVVHALNNPMQSVITGFAVSLLKGNVHFGDARMTVETPMIDQYGINAFLPSNFLAGHYASLYELIGTEVAAVARLAPAVDYDRFIALYGVNDAITDTIGTNNSNGFRVPVDNSIDESRETGDIFVLGLGGNDTIKTGSGRDFLAGGKGDDRLDGGTNADTLFGGSGGDVYVLDHEADVALEQKAGGTDTVHITLSAYTLGANLENLVIDGTASSTVFGNRLDNVITGNDAGVVIRGGGGQDTLYSGAGNDRLDGGAGADMMYGGAGHDSYVFNDAGDSLSGEIAGGGTDTIWSSVTTGLAASPEIENLRLRGTSAIDGSGNAGANLVAGNAAANVIAGDAGRDKLYGKGGADAFLFADKGTANRDAIADFDSDDTIRLDEDLFSGLITALDGRLSTVSFAIDKAVNDAAQIVYNAAAGLLSYDANGSAAGGLDEIATIGRNRTFFDQDDIFVV